MIQPEIQPAVPADDAAPRRRERGFAAVYEELREDILSLRIDPGSALDEHGLAARFGVSRTPIREALLMLSRESLVTILPSRSPIVAPHSMANAREYLDSLALLARAMARLAAEARNAVPKAAIRAAHDAYAAALAEGDLDRIIAADLAFHLAIADAAGNEFLARFHALTLDYGRRMARLHYWPHVGAAEREASLSDHREMLIAIETGDGARAEALASRHILSELRVIQRAFEPAAGLRFALTGD